MVEKPKRPLFLNSLLADQLFTNNSAEFVLSFFSDSDSVKIIKSVLFESNSETWLENEHRIKWLLQVMPFTFLHLKEDQAIISVLQFYLGILSSQSDHSFVNNLPFFNECVRCSFLHLSIMFEDLFFGKFAPSLLKSLKSVIKNESSSYSADTWVLIVKVLIGICNLNFSALSPFKGEPNIIKPLCKLLFLSLIHSNEKASETWDLFDYYSKNWSYQCHFCSYWRKFFEIHFKGLEDKNNDSNNNINSKSIIIHLLRNAQAIYHGPNSCVLHESFVIVADSVQKQNTPFSNIFEKKFIVDKIFSIFAVWSLAPGSESTQVNSVSSLVGLIEKSYIIKDSAWFSATIEYFIRELKDKHSNLTPNFIPKIGQIICAHPPQSIRIIPYLMKFFTRQLRSSMPTYQMNSIYIVSLFITIAETYLQKCSEIGTIDSIGKIIPLMSCDRLQFRLYLIMISGCYDMFWSEFNILVEKNEFYPNLLPYLLILPQFGFPFFKCNLLRNYFLNFIRSLILQKDIFVGKEEEMYYLMHTIVEISRNSELFQPLSAERSLLFSLLDKVNLPKSVYNFLLLNMCQQSHPIDPQIAYNLEKENIGNSVHYFMNDSVLTFIDQKGKPLIMIIRNIFGCLCYEIHDYSRYINFSSSSTTSNSDLAQKEKECFTINKPQACKELIGAFHDTVLLNETKSLTEACGNISFDLYSVNNTHLNNEKILSILTRLGLLTSMNPKKITPIETDLTCFFEEFDKIPNSENCNVGVVHFTNSKFEFPGESVVTASFKQFLMDVGSSAYQWNNSEIKPVSYKISTIDIVYISKHMNVADPKYDEDLMSLPVLIIFNDTSYRFVSNKFANFKSELVVGVELKSNGLYKIDFLKCDDSIPYPYLKGLSQLTSQRNLASSLALCVLLTMFSKKCYSLEMNKINRAKAIEKVSTKQSDLYAFFRK